MILSQEADDNILEVLTWPRCVSWSEVLCCWTDPRFVWRKELDEDVSWLSTVWLGLDNSWTLLASQDYLGHQPPEVICPPESWYLRFNLLILVTWAIWSSNASSSLLLTNFGFPSSMYPGDHCWELMVWTRLLMIRRHCCCMFAWFTQVCTFLQDFTWSTETGHTYLQTCCNLSWHFLSSSKL